jgi:hypothetical protein
MRGWPFSGRLRELAGTPAAPTWNDGMNTPPSVRFTECTSLVKVRSGMPSLLTPVGSALDTMKS